MLYPTPIKPADRLRSLHFVAAHDNDLVATLSVSKADAIVIDCAASPADQKAAGRSNAVVSVDQLQSDRRRVFTRTNPVDSPWFKDDLSFGLANEIEAVLVPRIETADQLDRIALSLAEADMGYVGIIAGIETIKALYDIRGLLAHRCVVATYFGAEGFTGDTGGHRTKSAIEVLYARSQVAMAAAWAGIAAFDHFAFSAPEAESDQFDFEAKQARSLGFCGKPCISNDQVEVANRIFS